MSINQIHNELTTATLRPNQAKPELVNDIHSQLNATWVKDRVKVTDLAHLVEIIKDSGRRGEHVSIAGGRHAMGGQQFVSGGTLLDITGLNRILDFDEQNGLLTVEAGIMWPDLIDWLKQAQNHVPAPWTIKQKQTGADNLSIGGAIAANVHGRVLNHGPFINDIEELTIVNAAGQVIKCSRNFNTELFSLVVGGYGLFGVVYSCTLRLTPLTILRRDVEVTTIEDAVAKLEERAKHGATYGDFQFAVDTASPDFIKKGILSTYTPVDEQPRNTNHKLLTSCDWAELLFLAHKHKTQAFEKYSAHYLGTNGQLYRSDTFQLATYVEDYHKELSARLSEKCRGTELITEVYVPREKLASFCSHAATFFRQQNANVIYGTVRLIERDIESFLPWASSDWACIIFNLHVEHSADGIAAARTAFTGLIDLAIAVNGSYYLTYHRFASREQILQCHPRLIELFRMKKKYDPQSLFSSDWHQHYMGLLQSERCATVISSPTS